MLPVSHPLAPADPPAPSSPGDVGMVLTLALILAFVSYPLWTLTALTVGILTVHAAKRAASELARRFDGRTRTLRIPRVGRIDYRFTTR